MADKKYKFQNIFDDLGIGNLDEGTKSQFFHDMNEIVELAVLGRIARMLSEENKKHFEALKTDDEKDKFLDEKGIDLQAVALEEAIKFRERMIADVNYVAGRVEEKKAEQDKKKNG